jgi:DNA-binding MarR family transcriptional regulator
MINKQVAFTGTEKRVIRALYWLDRWATINEIAEVANMSWNTANTIIKKFYGKRILNRKTINGKIHWRINNF